METHSHRWIVSPDDELDLATHDAESTSGAPGRKKETRLASDELRDRLADLQERLYAESRRSLLLVLQAMDAGGKDGAIKKVFSGVNPQSCKVTAFKAPTEEERAHDFLWRVYRHTPRAGDVAIFNRSHYEDVVIARVRGLVPAEVWRDRYDIIRDFERALSESGTRVVKVFLHIDKDEQAKRLQARLDDPARHWKFRSGDLSERERWDDYMAAYRDAIVKTSTAEAPWYVIPANHKWYRNWAMLSILVETLEDMDPHWPEPEGNLTGLKIR